MKLSSTFFSIRATTLVCALASITISCAAQIPAQDMRNTNTPDVKTPVALPKFSNLVSWEARKKHLREQVLSAAGLYPMPQKTPLHPQIFDRIDGDGYTIEKVLLETMPGYYLGGNIYRPKDGKQKHPAVLNPHGHWQYGRLENQPLYSGESFGVTLAKLGFVVFAYDMVGYTDTIQTPHDFANPERQLWSFTPLGLQLWNSTRGLDFLTSLDDVDAQQIGMAGASGGGTQTFLLTAVDDRIQFAAPVNMVSAIMQGGDACENAPGLRVGTNNVEIAAMFAPKPMLLVSATGDWTHNVPKEEFPAIQAIYSLYGKGDDVEVVQIQEKHNFNQASREAVYRFFAKRVLKQPDAASIVEAPMKAHKLQEMMATSARPLPGNALAFDGVFKEWREVGQDALRQADVATQRKALTLALGTQWPEHVLSEKRGREVTLSRPGASDRVNGIFIPGHGAAAIVIDPAGAQAAMSSEVVRTLIAAHRPVLLLNAFQTSSEVAPRDRSSIHFLTYNSSDDQSRVQDIATAIVFLSQGSTASSVVDVYGLHRAAIWSLLAAVTSPHAVKLHVDDKDLDVSEAELSSSFSFPGLERAGGIALAQKLLEATAPDHN
jgi:dienelactone hydrolase